MVFARFIKYFAVLQFIFFVSGFSLASAQTGLQNPSYENDLSGWSTTASESVTVITGENTTTSGNNQTFDINVAPLHGTNLVRLGSVKDQSENMNVGPNSVSQTFNSTSDAIIIGFKLYSWEHRDTTDTFTINVTQTSDPAKKFTVTSGAGTAPLSLSMYAEEPTQVCSETPCVLNVNSGSRGDFVNTGWQYVLISGLPSDGTSDSEVTVTYSLAGVSNEGHPSWAYIDSWNHDPVANFSVSREITIEGNVTRFVDTSTDEDPGDKIINRIWEITYTNDAGGTQTVTKYDASEISVIASNEGTVSAKLEVFDRFGGSDITETGETGPDGILPSVSYENSSIFVSKLDTYNVVAGSEGNLITIRYAKPGWDDQVTATWTITSGSGTLLQDEADNIQLPIPMMLKGMATIPFNAPNEPGTTIITLTLSEPAGGESVTRDITVNVLDSGLFAISQDEDGNDTPDTATVIRSGSVNVGHLNKLGDVDYYKITDKNGNNFPVGSEVYIRLRNTATDHDMFLVGSAEEISEEEVDALARVFSSRLARIYSSRLARIYSSRLARIYSSRLARVYSSRLARIYSSRLARVYSSRLARVYSSRLARIYTSRLSRIYSSRLEEGDNQEEQVVFTTPLADEYGWEEALASNSIHSIYFRDADIDPFSDQSIANGFDFEQIPLSESIFLPVQETDVSQKDIDVNETVLGDLSEFGKQVTLLQAEDGYNDEVLLFKVTSEDDLYLAVASENGFGSPYSIQLENSVSPNVEYMAEEACQGEMVVSNGDSQASTGLIAEDNYGDEVMYVINPQRMAALYGQGSWDSLYAKLQDLAESSNGKILAIHDLQAYADMDTKPCDVSTANVVSNAIRNAIAENRGETESVVLVGGDLVLPFYRVIDPSDFYERDYAAHTELTPRTPMYSAMFGSYILTDKYYANDFPYTGSTSKLLIPMWGVSRVVETPEEIISSIDHHVNNMASIEMNTGLVTAYDVVLDSGKEIADTFALGLQDGGITNITKLPHNFDLGSPWYAADIKCHLLGDESIPGCQSPDLASLNGHFTHDEIITQAGFELGINDSVTANDIEELGNGKLSGSYELTPGCHAGLNVMSLSNGESSATFDDFPSSYVKNGATYLAGTGYGIAGVNTSSFSEKLMGWHAKTVIRGGIAGMAAADADTFYMLDSINTGLSPYDIKAMYQSTLYGFANTALLPGVDIPVDEISGECTAGGDSRTFSLTVIDGESQVVLGTDTLNKVCTESGDYYQGSGKTRAETQRPIQPISEFIHSPSENNIRSILLEGATYTQEAINPVFLTPVTDNDSDNFEKSFCEPERFWPSNLIGHANFDSETMISFVSGQFICTDSTDTAGEQRLYTDATVRILRSNSSDTTAPSIHSVDPHVNDQGNVYYYVDATDASGISEILLTIYLDGGIKTIKTSVLPGENPYKIELNAEDSQLALNNSISITVIDGANNIAVASSKGRGIEHIVVDIEDSTIVSTLTPKPLTATITDYTLRRALAHSMSYFWDFGDGHFETGVVFNKNNADGDDDFDYVHPNLVVNEETGSATISTTHQYEQDTDVKVKFKVNDSSGGIGTDEIELQSCSDPSDFNVADGDMVKCGIGSSGTNVTIVVKVADGGVISPDYQYRLYLDFDNDGSSDLKLVYDNGSINKTNKVADLTASANGNELTISFDLAPTGWTDEIPLNWYMETQSGVAKGKQIGFPDMMPDSGYFTY